MSITVSEPGVLLCLCGDGCLEMCGGKIPGENQLLMYLIQRRKCCLTLYSLTHPPHSQPQCSISPHSAKSSSCHVTVHTHTHTPVLSLPIVIITTCLSRLSFDILYIVFLLSELCGVRTSGPFLPPSLPPFALPALHGGR